LDFWAHILQKFCVTYPLICAFIKLFLTLPASTAEVEQGFSFQNLIKSKLRNRLNLGSLDALMRLRLLGPPADQVQTFEIDEMMMRWNNGNRMPQRSGAGIPRRRGQHTSNHFTSDFLSYEADAYPMPW